ncbi:MAG: ABC transporter ATP-binding protein [Bacillota bacterium]|nr:MAG: ABC transporter ATP-binding protein [Bacillota bacterium]
MLDIRDLHVGYGSIKAVEGISLKVAAGEIVVLLGSNGAGKSTTLKTVSGLLTPSRGEIWFQDERIDGLPPHRVTGRHIIHCPEGRRVFPEMTVTENLEMGAYVERRRSVVKERMALVFDLFPRLKERASQPAGTMSGGEQQMLALGRALMGGPRLLLLDEPSLGLAPALVESIFASIGDISTADKTMGILLAEQNAAEALEIGDRGYVMETGRLTISGTAEELRRDETVQRAYLGAAVAG